MGEFRRRDTFRGQRHGRVTVLSMKSVSGEKNKEAENWLLSLPTPCHQV